MFFKRSIILVIILLIQNLIFCQDQNKDFEHCNLKPGKLKKLARSSRLYGDFYNAIYYYECLRKQKTKDYDLLFELGQLYNITRNYDSTISVFKELVILNNNKFKDAHFEYAKALMIKERYEEANQVFKSLKKNPRGMTNKNNLRLIRTYLKACEQNIKDKAIDTTKIVKLRELSNINQEHLDYSPYPLNDTTLIFSSLRLNPNQEEYSFVHKVYLAKKRNANWVLEKDIGWPINKPDEVTGNAVMDLENKYLYYTQTRKNWKGETISELFRCIYTDTLVGNPEKLPYPINQENYSSTQPAIGIDIRSNKEILYFSSNRPGGAGGMDIWFVYTNYREGEFSTPRNVGRRVNSLGNESAPFYNLSRNELYFSSDGLKVLGGKDIFKVKGSGSNWKKTEHLPYPINSSYDDSYITFIENSNNGFLASNRPNNKDNNQNCCEDIYYFTIEDYALKTVRGSVFNISSDDFYEMLSRKFKFESEYKKQGDPIEGVVVNLYEVDDEGEFLISSDSTDQFGDYEFIVEPEKKYYVKINNFGYFDKKVKFDTEDLAFTDTIELRKTGLNYIETDLALRIDIFFEFNKSKLNKDAMAILDTTILEIMQFIPNAVIELGSHTDNVGSESYNLKLSSKRAENVKKYLVEKGISNERLIAKGYGEMKPIAANETPDGNDNPEGRQMNRRTEIKIVDNLDSFNFDDF